MANPWLTDTSTRTVTVTAPDGTTAEVVVRRLTGFEDAQIQAGSLEFHPNDDGEGMVGVVNAAVATYAKLERAIVSWTLADDAGTVMELSPATLRVLSPEVREELVKAVESKPMAALAQANGSGTVEAVAVPLPEPSA